MEQYGLIGYPLTHSFSRDFFNRKFSTLHLDAEYLNFELTSISQLPEVIAQHPQLRGLNVTIPYKEQVIPYLHELSDEARAIGAVNVIRVTHTPQGTHLKGFNSDVTGFSRSIAPLLQPHHRKALVLGTGGASKAVVYGLHQLRLDTLYVSRSAVPGRITYDQLDSAMLQEYTVVVNCSPVGMYPHTHERPDLPYNSLDSRHLLFDLIYNPEETEFLREGRLRGAVTRNGLDMLIGQAHAGWEYWTGTVLP